MDKAQEALDRIKTNYCVVNGCNPFATDCDCPFQQDYEIVKNELEEYEQLKSLFREYNIDESNIREMLMIANMYKDKETPKKVINRTAELKKEKLNLLEKYHLSVLSDYRCPVCDSAIVFGFCCNYCRDCGQKLDWSDEND